MDHDIGDQPDGGMVGQGSIAITSPQPGSVHMRDVVGVNGWLVAPVALAVDAGGGIVRVTYHADDQLLGEGTGAEFSLQTELLTDGARTVRALGFDDGGNQVAQADVTITVQPANAPDCHGWLDLYGIVYELGPNNQGVPDPVTVTTPINGMPYRYVSNESPRDTFFMDCSLALSLAQAAPLLRERDVVEVADIGVYNYRCIGGGTPPDCPNGISQHAYAKAIDIAGVTTSDGTWYSVNDDWVIDGDSEPTCSAATENDKDALLHELICALKREGVWNIVLTPNYNDAHRNHFHVDLTTGADYINREAPTYIPRSLLH